MLSPEQANQVRKELIEQVESTFPPEKRDAAKRQVLEMSDESLEKFVKEDSSNCIFCSIASGKSQSYKIAEDENSVAVLEINPISKGHVIVIPREHKSHNEFPQTKEFANKVALLLKEKLSPKDIEISSFDFQGHGVVNLVPVYTNESMDSQRHKASKEELEEVLASLSKKTEEKSKPVKKKTTRKPRTKKLDSKKNWLPKRIP
jgi:histidine triad (HIT) family protein